MPAHSYVLAGNCNYPPVRSRSIRGGGGARERERESASARGGERGAPEKERDGKRRQRRGQTGSVSWNLKTSLP